MCETNNDVGRHVVGVVESPKAKIENVKTETDTTGTRQDAEGSCPRRQAE